MTIPRNQQYLEVLDLDLTIPHNQQYLEVLDTVQTDFLADKITKEQAMQQIERGWELLTNQVGRES